MGKSLLHFHRQAHTEHSYYKLLQALLAESHLLVSHQTSMVEWAYLEGTECSPADCRVNIIIQV